MKKLTVGLLAAALMLVLAVSAAMAAAKTPLALTQNPGGAKTLKHEPGVITFTGDGTGALAGNGSGVRHPGALKWSVWNGTQAKATGSEWLDDCTPNCAAGKFHHYPVSVRLYRSETLGGHLVYTRMTVTFTTSRKPTGAHDPWTDKVTYEKKYKLYFWG